MRRRPRSACGGSSVELDPPEGVRALEVHAPVVVEGAHAGALLAQQVEVDVGHRAPVAVGEALGLRQQHAVLEDRGLPVPREVGRGLALPGRRVDVRRQAARGRRPAQQLAVLRPPDGDRAPRQVEQHRRAGERRLGARRDRDPDVLADLGVDDEPGHVLGREQQVRAERHVGAADADRAALVRPRRELAALVELAVGRRVGLRRHAEHAAAVDDDRAVVDPVAVAQRRADDEHRQQLARGGDDGLQRGLDAVEHRVLQHEVLDRVARQAQLGEHGHRDAVLVAGAREPQDGFRVRGRVGDRHAPRAGGHAREPVLVERAEVHPRSLTRHAILCGMTTLPSALRLGAVELTVRDLDRAIGWYQQALGLRLHGRGDGDGRARRRLRGDRRPARGPAGAARRAPRRPLPLRAAVPLARGARPRRGAPGGDEHADPGRVGPPHPRGDLPPRRRRQRHRAGRRPAARCVAAGPRVRRRPGAAGRRGPARDDRGRGAGAAGRRGAADGPPAPARRRHRRGAALLPRRARLRGPGQPRLRRLRVRRRLSPPPRLQHLERARRGAAARAPGRAAPLDRRAAHGGRRRRGARPGRGRRHRGRAVRRRLPRPRSVADRGRVFGWPD